MESVMNIEMASEIQTLDFEGLNTLDIDPKEKERIAKHEAWLKVRLGRFTSSEIHRLCTTENKPNELPKGAETYIIEKVVEELTGQGIDHFTNSAMDWGNAHELEAIERFAEKMKFNVHNIGDNQKFIKYGKHAGGTPDGRGRGYTAESKCPNSKTHYTYVTEVKDATTLKAINKAYYWQIQSQIFFDKKKCGYFISFDPRFKIEKRQLHIVRIERIEKDILFMKNRLDMAINRKCSLIKEFKNS